MVTASPGNDSGAVSIYPHKSAVGIRRFGHSHRRHLRLAEFNRLQPGDQLRQRNIQFRSQRLAVGSCSRHHQDCNLRQQHIERAITAERAADAQPVAARANCTASLDRSNSESSLANCGPKNRATLYRAPNVLGTRCARSSWRSSSPWSVILKSLVAKVIGWQRDAQ